ncbi:TetR/AcrR family transcriptional regulator [Streptomyces sp. NBC_00178]|uniref:TetR/AcrR family transcriptional regulator n=1 Tax=Streptomyces sp. NBC_00178 TaxID=2975672 RepID=UPI002E2A6048|nr:helix-turn-helix domain-containing protein [Streptomyces sp. NBC_00178]
MPTAREALLDAAHSALSRQSWTSVRMVDVAARAGVSRQTLYNEFGSKDGLARALIRRAADGYLAGVDRTLGADRRQGDGPAELARWTVRAAGANALVKALLTGVWGERLPRPVAPAAGLRTGQALPTPGELLMLVRDRAVVALREGPAAQDRARLELTCEIALRLAVSYTLVPADPAAGGAREAQAEDPESCSPMTPTITREIDTSFRVETTSSRKTMP